VSGFHRRLRALLIGIVACLLAVGAAACGGSSDSGGSGTSSSGGGGGGAKIALLLPETKTTRYEQQDKPNFIKRVKELCPDCEVLYSNADQDASKQQQQAEAAITEGAKAIVISAVDVKSAGAIVQRANQSDIPVIAYGRLIPDADIAYYVSIDPYKVGQQQADVLDAKLSDMGVSDPRVVMINGSPTDSNSKPYKDGALNVFKKDGVKIVKSYDTPDWSPDKAQQETQQAITALGQNGFDAVYVANDGMASGAIAALKGAQIDPASKPVTGQDAELAGIQRIIDGEQLMTVYQPLHQLASAAADLAVPLAQGKQPDASLAKQKVDNGSEQVPSVLLDTIAIKPGNVEDTIIKDNFLTADQICTGPYAKDCQKYGIK
jgi:D-xylose transport system substrate-binding protein